MSILGAINTRNYSQKTNFKCGADILNLLPFYVITLNIPDISANIQEISGRFGTTMNVGADVLVFGALNLEVILDEDYTIYKDIINNFYVQMTDGTFSTKSFDFWTEVTNDMGQTVLKLEYSNCFLESVSELSLATNDDTTEQTFSISIKYDYFKLVEPAINDNQIPSA